jgi:hypothetical protein
MAYGNGIDRDLSRAKHKLDVDTRVKLLTLIAEGEPIRKACREIGTSWQTVARELIMDPLFKREWDLARQQGADIRADDLATAFDGAETVADAMICKGKSDNLRTLAAFGNPGRYSPKMQVEHTHTLDLSKAMELADKRASTIEAEPIPNQLIDSPRMELWAERNELRDKARAAAIRDNAPEPIDVEATVIEPNKDEAE